MNIELRERSLAPTESARGRRRPVPGDGPSAARAAVRLLKTVIPAPEDAVSWAEVRRRTLRHPAELPARTLRALDGLGARAPDAVRQIAAAEQYIACVRAVEYLKLADFPREPFLNRYAAWVRQLRTIAPAAVDLDPRGTIFVSAHLTHLGQVTRFLKATLGDRLHVVRKPDLASDAAVNAQLILMLKMLGKGGAVLLSPDGRNGAAFRAVDVFGTALNLSPGFAWLAWKSGADVRFCFQACAEPKGLAFTAAPLGRRGDGETDEAAFTARMIEAYAARIRALLLERPFDAGALNGLKDKPTGGADGRPEKRFGLHRGRARG